VSATEGSEDPLYRDVGRLTRQLHEALRALGGQAALQRAVEDLPDARDRLAYVSRLTGEAADKVLDGVEQAKLELGRMTRGAQDLAHALHEDPAGALASGRLVAYLQEVGESCARADALLTGIMLAQDFHDLTGQVIRKVVVLAQTLEVQLLRLLLERGPRWPAPAPGEAKPESAPMTSGLQGPVLDAAGRNDLAADQKQVDDLLESLGF
jgi:chemotaxis protein CheZ